MPGFSCEYAKSGRSTCKGCNKLIEQGALRIGKMVQSPHFDGEMALWHHRACLFKREVISNVALIKGLDGLRPEDAKSLREQVAANTPGGAVAALGGAAAAALPSSVAGDSFKIEYAKSGRSTCKHCGEKVDQDEIRLGKMVQSASFDGLVPLWHHLDCIFKAAVVYSAALVEGWGSLRPEDAKEVKALIAKHSPATAGGAAAAAPADTDVDMAKKSGKGKGKKKKRGADDDEDDEDYDGDGGAPPAKAAKMAPAEDYSKLTVAQLQAKCKELGLKSAGKKAELVARLEEAQAAAPASAGASARAAAAAAAPPEDPVRAGHQAALDAESAARWKIKDALSDLSTSEIKQLLAHNDMPDKVVHGVALIDRLVDALQYGLLPACPDCGNNTLAFKDGEYVCQGHASEWGRCLYRADDVKRTPLDVGDSDHAYLSKKHKLQTKPLAAHRFFAAEVKAAQEQHKALTAEADRLVAARKEELARQQVLDELFSEFVVTFVGSKGFKDGDGADVKLKDLKALVETHGGEVTADVDDADLIVTTPEDVKADKNKKLKQAHEAKKPVLLASFLTTSVAKAELQEPKDFSALSDAALADGWTDLKSKVESGRQKSGAKLASASAAANGKSGLGKKSGASVVKLKIKGRGAVDEDSGLSDTTHILEERDAVWTFTGSVADVTSGINSYYIMQLLEADGKNKFWVFRKWGRVGTDVGKTKLTDHGSSKDNAKHEFREVFLEKTGNAWEDRAKFQKKAGKFNLVDVDYSADTGDDAMDAAAADVEGASESKLDKRIQDLIRVFFDVQAIKKTLAEMSIDLEKMPLGKLSRAHIKSGYAVLTEVQAELEKGAAARPAHLLALSNQFYSIIPHDFGLEKPTVLDSLDEIKKKLEMIDTLLEVETATKLLKQGKEQDKDAAAAAAGGKAEAAPGQSMDPIDVHYRQLKTDMRVLEREEDDFKLIQTYITNTHAATHRNYTLDLLDVFAVDRENEAGRYAPFEQNSNRMLLWHGSRTTNYVGILSQGLRIAPPEAPVTGYMFGKGVYFADMVSKSANYCFTSASNNVGFLLLCEVALGEMNLLKNAQYMDKAPGKCLSTKGIGLTSPDPAGNVVLPNGCVVPAGKGTKTENSSSLLYNEFIVYDVGQIRMKYLLKVRFNYAGRW